MDDAQRKIAGLSLIAAPLLMGISTLFWEDGRLGVTGGMTQVLASVFWTAGLLALWSMARPRSPRLAAWMSLLTIYSGVAGGAWGLDGIYRATYGALGDVETLPEAAHPALGVAMLLTLFLPGLLFPVSVLAVAVSLGRAGAIPTWAVAMLCLGAAAFPAGRIPNIQAVAHLADLMLLVPSAWLGWRLLSRSGTAAPA
jgi:hypothetical protein